MSYQYRAFCRKRSASTESGPWEYQFPAITANADMASNLMQRFSAENSEWLWRQEPIQSGDFDEFKLTAARAAERE